MKNNTVRCEVEAFGKIVNGYNGKKMISYTGGKNYRYDMEGDIDYVIDRLIDIRDKAVAEGYRDICIDISAFEDYGSSGVEIRIDGRRDMNEMELEFDKKMAEEMKAKKKDAEEKERAEYERLKAKFEKS